MPYSIPPPSPTSSATPPTTPTTEAPLSALLSHKRTRSTESSFSDEQGPGAFVSFGALPKRKPAQKKALFHFDEEDQDQQEKDNADHFLSLKPDHDPVPFPHASFLLIPRPPTKSQHPPDTTGDPIPRGPSEPIILPNGKPLKSSLKSSSSSPHIPQIKHLRAQSAPATPNALKNVHFAEGLESVRVYSQSSKPVNISRPAEEDTDTETDTESSAFLSRSPTPPTLLPIIDSDKSAPLPNFSDPNANIYIEKIFLPTSRPPALYGSILVRNITFEKQVALRFTLDDWETTSEALCKHVTSLSHLPPPFPGSTTVGDAVDQTANGDCDPREVKWDRFSFVIRLDLYERTLADRTILFVGRYTALGVGEWWDNNGGGSYRLSFKQPPKSSDPHVNDAKMPSPQEANTPSASGHTRPASDHRRLSSDPLLLDTSSGGLNSASTITPADSDTPAWKRLISRPLLPLEAISLIGVIFTSKLEVKKVCDLRGDDAQTFIDGLHEVRFVFLPFGGTADYLSPLRPFTPELLTSTARLWISLIYHHPFEGSV